MKKIMFHLAAAFIVSAIPFSESNAQFPSSWKRIYSKAQSAPIASRLALTVPAALCGTMLLDLDLMPKKLKFILHTAYFATLAGIATYAGEKYYKNLMSHEISAHEEQEIHRMQALWNLLLEAGISVCCARYALEYMKNCY